VKEKMMSAFRAVRMMTAPLAVLVGLAVFGGCAITQQSRDGGRSGFLGDYSMLQPGEEGQAQLVYVNPTARWSQYDKVWIDSVTLWRDASTDDLPDEEAQMLTDHLYAALHEELARDHEIVDSAGPGVLRLRAALTEAQGSKVVMNTVTSVIPQLRLLATAGGMATGTAALVGKAGVEAELVDSLSGERLAAAVDARQGTKAVRGGIGKWSDAQQTFKHWAERFRERLAELRGA
jgi:hypothetical protein